MHTPRSRIIAANGATFCLFALLAIETAQGSVKKLLYSLPKLSPTHIYIYDIENGHKLVDSVAFPTAAYARGIAASSVTDRIWSSYWEDFKDGTGKVIRQDRNIVCIDVGTKGIVWKKTFSTSNIDEVDRLDVTPDGKKLYGPYGEGSYYNKMRVIDATNGNTMKTVDLGTGKGTHNVIASPDGKRVYVGGVSAPDLVIVDASTDQVIKRIGPFRKDATSKVGVRPFTINADESLAFCNINLIQGFAVGDLKTGSILHVVASKRPADYVVTNPDPARLGHGITLTPDNKEVWVIDPEAPFLHVFDVTSMPPKQIASVRTGIIPGFNQWLASSIEGQYIYSATGEVVDRYSRTVVANLKHPGTLGVFDMNVEMWFDGVDVVKVGKQFGVGRLESTPSDIPYVRQQPEHRNDAEKGNPIDIGGRRIVSPRSKGSSLKTRKFLWFTPRN